ncbi:MAG: hydroxyacid dehydrogenase [Armatimonadota bacterium]
MNITAFEVDDWEQPAFGPLQDAHEVHFIADRLTADNAREYADTEILSVFAYSQVTREVLEVLPRVKMIATRSTGVDHIDLAYCRERGIVVSNTPKYGANTVAEHTFGLILVISHRLYDAIARTRHGRFSFEGLQGFDLEGRTLGVIGTGSIGKHVIRIARGFGMEVIAFDVKHDDDAARELGFSYVELDALLARADIVTLHVPGSEKTRLLISTDQFRQMKDGAVLINTARGDVVDIQALAQALAEGKLAAAGLDVLPKEPVIREETELLRHVYQDTAHSDTVLADSVLMRLENVYITPHSAFFTREAVQRMLETTVKNIASFLEGHPTNTVVRPE